MRVIYVAGKYRADTENGVFENIIHARREAQRLWQKGWAVICPHTNSMFMGSMLANEVFMQGDLEIVRRCDAIYMLSNYKDSEGALRELELAKELGLKIYYEHGTTN